MNTKTYHSVCRVEDQCLENFSIYDNTGALVFDMACGENFNGHHLHGEFPHTIESSESHFSLDDTTPIKNLKCKVTHVPKFYVVNVEYMPHAFDSIVIPKA